MVSIVGNSLIEGSLKYRDGKKWKQRWAVLFKLSPVADTVRLEMFRDSRDKVRGSPSKASFLLSNPLSLCTGFVLDKECHTLSLLCQQISIIVSFESRGKMLQWNAKLNSAIGQERQFLLQMLETPSKSRVCLGPSRFHIRDGRVCLTTGTPPKLMGAWRCGDLRRFGVVDGKLVWEAGKRSGRMSGVFMAISDVPHEVEQSLDLATRGLLTKTDRRTSMGYKGYTNKMKRTPSSWLQDVSYLDKAHYFEGENSSIGTSDASSCILSPSTCISRTDIASVVSRMDHTLNSEGSYVAGSSSSSGSIVGDDIGWWGNSHKCHGNHSIHSSCNHSNLHRTTSPSLAAQTIDSLAGDSLYDTPQNIHLLDTSRCPRHANRLFQHTSSCPHQKRINFMENYDVPKNHQSALYDVPRKLFSSRDRHRLSCRSISVDSESRSCACQKQNYLKSGSGFQGSGTCRRHNMGLVVTDKVKIDGEGRMPVVDANTGLLIKPFVKSNRACCNCSRKHDTPLKPSTSFITPLKNMVPENIYAVVDKSKKTQKPRAPSPPTTPDPEQDTTPTNENINYSNLSDLLTKSDSTHETSNSDDSYVLMGPISTSKLPSKHPCNYARLCGAGRSLSLARKHDRCSSSNYHRRSLSADSRLTEFDPDAFLDTPLVSPSGTPLSSPPNSPLLHSRRNSCSSNSRGRQRKKIRPQKYLFQDSDCDKYQDPQDLQDTHCQCGRNRDYCLVSPSLRRSSSVPSRNSKRDSVSSCDSGVYDSPRCGESVPMREILQLSERVRFSNSIHSSLPRSRNHCLT